MGTGSHLNLAKTSKKLFNKLKEIMFKELEECMITIINQLEEINNQTNYKTTKFRSAVGKNVTTARKAC